MKRVITYGTYDLLHHGHIRLLERAKALGDYLIVGVTADDFDQARGKINVQQSLMERMDAVRSLAFVDEVIVEEYEGQKIDDILHYDIDIFAIGSDWEGKLDYLQEYCKVVYLERTQGVSSSELRAKEGLVRLGLVGSQKGVLEKYACESSYVNGINVAGAYMTGHETTPESILSLPIIAESYEELLPFVDALYLISRPQDHFAQIKLALQNGKHVLCESPIAMHLDEWKELKSMAREGDLILMDAIRTAYSIAYYRLLLLIKSGCIGEVISVDASCSSLRDLNLRGAALNDAWNSICAWGPNALLPVFHILGTGYESKQIISKIIEGTEFYDSFTKISFIYPNAVASIKVGMGVKTEGELVVSGTTGYIYVPAPWWKMDYFEIRREDPSLNKRYFYQLDGEGIRYELVSFVNTINKGYKRDYISDDISSAIVKEIGDFYNRNIQII